MALRDTNWLSTGVPPNYGNARVVAITLVDGELADTLHNSTCNGKIKTVTHQWVSVSQSAVEAFMGNRDSTDQGTYRVTPDNQIVGGWTVERDSNSVQYYVGRDTTWALDDSNYIKPSLAIPWTTSVAFVDTTYDTVNDKRTETTTTKNRIVNISASAKTYFTTWVADSDFDTFTTFTSDIDSDLWIVEITYSSVDTYLVPV